MIYENSVYSKKNAFTFTLKIEDKHGRWEILKFAEWKIFFANSAETKVEWSVIF